MSERWISVLFYLSAAYDGVLGILFLFAPLAAFHWFDVPPPNHLGYVQFPAMLLLIFAIMFLVIAKNPQANRELIQYGILLKLSYCSITALYWFKGELPAMWQPFTICDLIMGALYFLAYFSLQKDDTSVAPS